MTIARLAIAEKARRFARKARRTAPAAVIASGPAPEKLLLAPQDLFTADPTSADDLYSGMFFLGGTTIDCRGGNPFSERNAPVQWQRELHSFGWIRHLEAEGSARSKSCIQARISDWMALHGKPSGRLAWDNQIAARRLMAWLCHSVPVVENATPRFYQSWLKSIGIHIRILNARCEESPVALDRLYTRIALCYAAFCVDGQSRRLRKAPDRLDEELAAQIYPDGGHLSRNPQVLVELLALLLPLRESYKRLGKAPSPGLVSSIDRIMVALKFFQLGDGNLARFNGSGGGRADLLATVLQYDDFFGTAPESARDSGFQRMALGETIILADTGAPPRNADSTTAHAGTLSFEMSSGDNLIFVNCGVPTSNSSARTAARATAAHSTLILNNTSSSRFYSSGNVMGLLGDRIISGVSKVECTRENTSSGKRFKAGHDGYLKRFGVVHSRMLHLTAGGNRIEGIDKLVGKAGKPLPRKGPLDFAIRFHVHPSVSAGKTDNGASILMMCGRGLAWKLTCLDCLPEIEESVYFSPTTGAKRSKQIVLAGNARETPEVRWLLVRQRVSGK